MPNPEIFKTGEAIDRDISELQALAPFQPDGFVELTNSQKTYAATDAWLGRKIYLSFKNSELI